MIISRVWILFNRCNCSFLGANVQEADQRGLVLEIDTRGVDIRDPGAADQGAIVEIENAKPAEAGKIHAFLVSLKKFASLFIFLILNVIQTLWRQRLSYTLIETTLNAEQYTILLCLYANSEIHLWNFSYFKHTPNWKNFYYLLSFYYSENSDSKTSKTIIWYEC